MTKKASLHGMNVLFISLSKSWNTIERRCLKDASYLVQEGAECVLFCKQKSYLDEEARKLHLECLYTTGDDEKLSGKISLYFQLKEIIQDNNIDIIHVFDEKVLKIVSFLSKSISRIPLFYTFNQYLPVKNLNVFSKWVYSRIDNVFCLTNFSQFLASEALHIPLRKIENVGTGMWEERFSMDFLENNLSPNKKETKKREEKQFHLMSFISKGFEDIDKLKMILDSLQIVIEKLKLLKKKQEIHLTFTADIPWQDHLIFDELKRVVLERHLEHRVHFKTYHSLVETLFLDKTFILIGLESNELIRDIHILALLGGHPLILPRMIGCAELLLQGKLGQTYYPSDKRELNDKILKITANLESYREKIFSVREELLLQHQSREYFLKTISLYLRRYTQRIRYSQKRHRL